MTDKIKALMLDMGGVMVRLDLPACLKAFREKAGFADVDKFLNEYKQHGYMGALEEGRITEEEFYAETLKYCRPGTTPEVIRGCFKEFLPSLIPDTMSLIRELNAEGFPLYILSNNNPICARIVTKMMAAEGIDIEKSFRKVFYSHEMCLSKPQREIYLQAIKETGLRPEEILFVDDNRCNTEGGTAVGLNTLLYSEGTDILDALRKLNAQVKNTSCPAGPGR